MVSDPPDPDRFSPEVGGSINRAASVGFDGVVVGQAFHWFDAASALVVRTHPRLDDRESFAFPSVTQVFRCDRA